MMHATNNSTMGTYCMTAARVQDYLVTQQLGPVPPPRASPGMLMQYTTMFAERRASLLVDNISGLIENLAGVIVKVRHDAAASGGVLLRFRQLLRVVSCHCCADGMVICDGPCNVALQGFVSPHSTLRFMRQLAHVPNARLCADVCTGYDLQSAFTRGAVLIHLQLAFAAVALLVSVRACRNRASSSVRNHSCRDSCQYVPHTAAVHSDQYEVSPGQQWCKHTCLLQLFLGSGSRHQHKVVQFLTIYHIPAAHPDAGLLGA